MTPEQRDYDEVMNAVSLLACELQHWVLDCEDLDYRWSMDKTDDFVSGLDDLAKFVKDTQRQIQKPLWRLKNKDNQRSP